MNRSSAGRIAAGLALVALVAGCDKGKEKPSGQVVATVEGEDITIHELNSEMAQARPPAGMPRKQVEQLVLSRIVERKMLANAARERGLDKNPNFLLAQRRVDDGLLVQALQTDIAQKVVPTTREAAQKYIESHPDQFAQRKIFAIDQIQFLRPANVAQLKLEPAKTINEVAALLSAAKVEFRRAPAAIDALTVNPELVAEIGRILARNPDEVFIFANQPQGAPSAVMYVNKVTEVRTVPFTGEQAVTFAQELLRRQNIQTALVSNLKTFQAAAKPKISYAAGYAPPAPPAKTPAPASSAPSASPATPAAS